MKRSARAASMPAMEHWLPLFHRRVSIRSSTTPAARSSSSGRKSRRRARRALELIADYYATRESLRTGKGQAGETIAAPYKPLKPAALYLSEAEWDRALQARPYRLLSPFGAPDSVKSTDAGGRPAATSRPSARRKAAAGRTSSKPRRAYRGAAEGGQARRHRAAGAKAPPTAWAACSPITGRRDQAHRQTCARRRRCTRARSALPCSASSTGSKAPDFALITEQDILGDRMVRSRGRARRSQNFLAEASSLAPGDLVTHIEHGVGRYLGLKTIDVAGAPHDCLELQYDGGKLFLPVENIELLTRYGSEEAGVQLDKLGGVGWQSRKARMKARVREMAAELIRIAAARAMKQMPADRDAGRALRRILRALSLCRDRGSGTRHRRRDRGSRQGPADGSADLRRCRLRQDRGGVARGLRHGDVGESGRRRRADDAAGAPALPHVLASASPACR